MIVFPRFVSLYPCILLYNAKANCTRQRVRVLITQYGVYQDELQEG